MKKRIFTAVALSVFFALSANAAEITDDFNVTVNLVNEERTVEIEGYIYGFDNIAITSSLEYLGPTDEYIENDNGEMYAVEQFLTDSDGNYSVDLLLREGAPSGWYKALISGAFDIVGDNSDFVHYLFYFDEDAFLETVAAINSCEDASELSDIFTNNPYLGCEGTADFCEIFLNLMEEYGDFDVEISVSDLRDAMDERASVAKIICKINESESYEEAISSLMKICGFSEEEIDEYADDTSKIFEKADKNFENFAQTEEFLKQSIALAKVNNATYESMTDVLQQNAQILGIDLSDYNTVKKIDVNKLITRKNFSDIKTFKDAFNAAVREIKNKDSSSSSSGGPSGNKVSSGKNPGIGAGGILTPVQNPQQSVITDKSHCFTDLKDAAWAEESIVKLYEKGIVTGKSETEFCPNDPITREEFATLIVRAFNLYNENAQAGFNDVLKNSWYEIYVASAYNSGVVSGKDDGNFGVGELISREDAATMLYRVSKLKGIGISENSDSDFADFDKVSDYARIAVSSLANADIINGVSDTEFAPKANTTRAQAAKLIEKILYREG